MTARALRAVDSPSLTLGDAVSAYLATLDHPESRNTARQYGLTLRRLARDLGDGQDVAAVTAGQLSAWVTQAWGDCKPATWNAGRTCLRSAWAWFAAEGWAAPGVTEGIARRKVAASRDRAIPRDVLDALLADQRIALRERTLWRLLAESAAREAEVLGLDVQDLDMPHNRAKVVRKGGAADVIVYRSGTAMLLPRLLKRRKSGPVFVTNRKAPAGTPLRDVAPGGWGRLSARQAQAIFRRATENYPGGPYVLHSIRHRAATDAAEEGASAVMLMALGGWENVKSVARYARPSTDALAAWQAGRDTNRRH